MLDAENLPAPVERNPAPSTWSEALITDLALGTSVDTILEVYDLQFHQLQDLLTNPAFSKQVAEAKVEMSRTGVTFELKARIQADKLLDTSWALIHNPSTPANVKADLIKNTVRWAGFDKGATAEGGKGGFSLTINLSNLGGVNPSANSVTIEGEVSE